MDSQKLITRYKQFGGMRLVWEYARLGALWPAAKAGVRCLVRRQSFKGIYPEVLKKVEPFLAERFQVSRFKFHDTGLMHEHPKVIWWCWLQGIEAAPPIVKACYNSIKRHITDREINVIDERNWSEYVELPGYIVEKWAKGLIPAALFSDLLRLQLLIKYGGTWIDTTVLCSARGEVENSTVREYLDAGLFLFQYTPRGTSGGIQISNWFISAYSNNEVLIVLRDMLFAYWKDYNCTLDYYIFHLFFSMVAEEYPEQIAAMPYGCSMDSLVLLHHWGEKFDQQKWDKLTSRVPVHKLAFRVNDSVKNDKENYYNHILSEYGRF